MQQLFEFLYRKCAIKERKLDEFPVCTVRRGRRKNFAQKNPEKIKKGLDAAGKVWYNNEALRKCGNSIQSFNRHSTRGKVAELV